MKKTLAHDDFNGEINGYSRRTILHELIGNRYVLLTKWDRMMRKVKYFLFSCLVVIALLLSAFALGKWLAWDVGYEYAVKQIYSGNAKQVEQNKKKAMSKLAGAGDDGVRRVWERE